jgi:hypothetical protein
MPSSSSSHASFWHWKPPLLQLLLLLLVSFTNNNVFHHIRVVHCEGREVEAEDLGAILRRSAYYNRDKIPTSETGFYFY